MFVMETGIIFNFQMLNAVSERYKVKKELQIVGTEVLTERRNAKNTTRSNE